MFKPDVTQQRRCSLFWTPDGAMGPLTTESVNFVDVEIQDFVTSPLIFLNSTFLCDIHENFLFFFLQILVKEKKN